MFGVGTLLDPQTALREPWTYSTCMHSSKAHFVTPNLMLLLLGFGKIINAIFIM